MLVGLYDHDMMIAKHQFTPSLELMQYASYYKRQGHTVRMLYGVDDIEPYDKIILHQGKLSKTIESELILNPKVEWIGEAFFDGKYNPPPQEIIDSIADLSIYWPYIESRWNTFGTEAQTLYRQLFKYGAAARFTHNGKLLVSKLPFIEQRNILLYDRGLLEGDQSIFQVYKQYPDKKLIIVYPQWTADWDAFCKSKIEMPNLREYKKTDAFVYYGDLSKKQLIENLEIFDTRHNLGLKPLKPNENLDEYSRRELLEKGNYYFYAVSKNKVLKLSATKEICPTSSLPYQFMMYVYGIGRATNKTFMQFLQTRAKTAAIEMERLIKIYPELYTIAYSNNADINKGGYWKL